MSTIQQAPTFSGVKINPNLAPLMAPMEAAQNTTSKLGLHDVKSATMTDFASVTGKPQLAAPLTAVNHDLMLSQLDGLEAPENTESLGDLCAVFLATPERLKQTLTTVMQREAAITDKSAGSLLDALATDDEEQRNLASAAQMLLGSSLLKEMNTARTGLAEGDNKVESLDSAKQREFVGIQTNDMMRFLLSMLRQVMAELNISERRINNMFSALSAEMTEKAAESTIREGQQIYHSAVIGFATSMAITGVGTGLQAGGLFKQNQIVKSHLKPANQHSVDAKKLSLNMNQTEGTAKSSVIRTSADGNPMQQATTPNPAQEAQFKQQQQQRVNETQNQGDLHRQKYDQQTNKYRTLGSVTDQMTRMSDNAGQLSSASNTSAVKEAEADKMMQSAAADITRGIASDKEKQIEKSTETMKEIRGHISAMRDATVRTNQSLVKG